MARKEWTEAEQQTARSMAAAGESDPAIGKALGRNPKSVGLWRQRNGIRGGRYVREEKAPPKKEPPPPADEFSRDNKGDTEYLHSKSTRIRTLDELLAAAAVDLTVWEVERFVVNKWESAARLGAGDDARIETAPLYQVKAWLRRNRKAERLVDVGERILADIAAHAPTYPAYAPAIVRGERYMTEWSAPDLHLGKLAWAPEAGEDWDMRIARETYLAALEDAIQKASGFPTEKWLVPIGNDFFQYDNLDKTTTAGTPQDTDSRYAKMFQVGEQLLVAALDRLAVIAPVHGIVVPGNHDRQTALTLGRVLSAWYRNTDRVTIDCSPTLRKYVRYGSNLLGFTHGSEEKPADLPLIMATEAPRDWSETTHREWHIGHTHRSKETRYTAGESFKGVRVRILPALCAADAWHASKGYVGEARAAETYLWSHDGGYAGHFSSQVPVAIPEPLTRAA